MSQPFSSARRRCFVVGAATLMAIASGACSGASEATSDGADITTPDESESNTATGSANETDGDGFTTTESQEHDGSPASTPREPTTSGDSPSMVDDDTAASEATNTDDSGETESETIGGSGGMSNGGRESEPEPSADGTDPDEIDTDEIDTEEEDVAARECPGSVNPENGCRSNAECIPPPAGGAVTDSTYYCGFSAPAPCEGGAQVVPVPVACSDDSDCGIGFRCRPDDPLADGRGCVVLRCDQPDAANCGDGLTCDPDAELADTRGCVTLRCSDGSWQCPAPYDCDPSANADLNGCAPHACSDDSDCACGYCVEATCQATLGTCYERRMVPCPP